jgi:hypothetical protein
LRKLDVWYLKGLMVDINLAKKRFSLSADAPVVGCDEADRGGFSRKTPGQV